MRLSCRAAALAGSYEAASQDLLTYAGLPIDAKQLQRLVSLMAPVMNRWRQAQQPSLALPRRCDDATSEAAKESTVGVPGLAR